MPQCSPLSGQVLQLCHRVSSPEECGLATFWLLIVCVKSMSGAHVLCFEGREFDNQWKITPPMNSNLDNFSIGGLQTQSLL